MSFSPTTRLVLTALLLLISRAAGAETCAIRKQGDCDLSRHTSRQQAYEVAFAGRMQYAARISCNPWEPAKWVIGAPLSVTNATAEKVYCHYYVAFFDGQDRLVGCSHQGTPTGIGPGTEGLQLGSCIVRGPRQRLLSARRFKLVLYESDRPIGVAGVSAEKTAEKRGESAGPSGKTVVKLRPGATRIVEGQGWAEIRLGATCSFQAPAEGMRNTQLTLAHGGNRYAFYLYARRSDDLLVVTGGGQRRETRLRRWQVDGELERRKKDGLSDYVGHVALLSARDQLVVAGSHARTRWLTAPADELLSAAKLQLVIYETPAGKAQDEQPAAQP